MSAAAAYKPAHGGYPGTVQTGAVRDTGRRKMAAELHAMLCIALRVGSTEDVGICILVADLCDEKTRKHIPQMLKEAIATWPEHSGDSEYPVPDPSGAHTPARAYALLSKWGNTPYGLARRRLLWHCIDWCEAEMVE